MGRWGQVFSFITSYWPALLGGVIAVIVGLRPWVGTRRGQMQWDRYRLRLPVVGGISEQIALSRFARNYASTLTVGVPATIALTVVADANDSTWIGHHIHAMRPQIERGARASGMFIPLVLQMISVGEEPAPWMARC